MKETDLYPPVAEYLQEQGYHIDCEVKDIDLVASRGEDLIGVELKRAVSLTLVKQAAWRQREVESIYAAVPHPGRGIFRKSWKKNEHLLRRLSLGLILVRFDGEGRGLAEVAFHPEDHPVRVLERRRRTIIREVRGRTINYNRAGSTRERLMTAYREKAVRLAVGLDAFGPQTPAELRRRGAGDKQAAGILRRNMYGWFDREEGGVYALHPDGRLALEAYRELADLVRRELMGG